MYIGKDKRPYFARTGFLVFPLLAIVLTVLFSCAPAPRLREPAGDYVWPLPPEPPRIKYIRSFWGEDDVRKPTVMDYFAGKDPSRDLIKPYGVFADGKGRLYVTDTVRRAVFVFDKVQGRLNILGADRKIFGMPVCVVADGSGRIYVSDTAYDVVMVLDSEGNVLDQFGKGILDNPSGMAIDREGNRIYVVSTKAHRVEVFSPAGKHLFGFGGRGNAPGLMNYPTDIAIDGAGSLYVVDSANFRVQVFTSEGKYLREFGGLGAEPGHFTRPKGIAIDSMNNVYVTDAAFNNFQVFDSSGRLLLFVGSQGMVSPGEFSLPAGISIDAGDRMYVADQLNRKVQVFQILK